MVYSEIIAVFSQNHTKHTNTLCMESWRHAELYLHQLLLFLEQRKPQYLNYCTYVNMCKETHEFCLKVSALSAE